MLQGGATLDRWLDSYYDKTTSTPSLTLAVPDTAIASPTPRSLARDAAAIAAAAAPPARRPREPPPKWLYPPERAPNAKDRRRLRRVPPPEWWELHPLVWFYRLSGRQKKWLGKVGREQGWQRAREDAARVVADAPRQDAGVATAL